MNVKGTAFLARKMLLEAEFGESVAKKYLEEAVAAVPSFPQLVLASTLIPMGPFLLLQDELLRRYYDNDPMSFFRFGETSAEWALLKGPYRGLAANKDIDTFIATGSAIYKTYFDVGSATTSLEDGHIAYRIEGVPREFRHVYVEYATLGYFKRALEILGATNVEVKRVQGFSSGNANVYYEIHFHRAPVSTRAR
jgi:hypothetical protein